MHGKDTHSPWVSEILVKENLPSTAKTPGSTECQPHLPPQSRAFQKPQSITQATDGRGPSTSRVPILFLRRNVPFPSDGKRTLHGWNICPPDTKHPHNTKHSTIKGRLHLNKLTNSPLSPPYIQDIPQSPIPQQHSKATPSSWKNHLHTRIKNKYHYICVIHKKKGQPIQANLRERLTDIRLTTLSSEEDLSNNKLYETV